jgi:hypothetical protein
MLIFILMMFAGVGLFGTFTAFISSCLIAGIYQKSNNNSKAVKSLDLFLNTKPDNLLRE